MNINWKKYFSQRIIISAIILVLIFIVFGVYEILYLQKAHSSFENYYAFRGCVQLIEKTDTYGRCKTQSGEIIEIVEYQGKWYLDGDLPSNENLLPVGYKDATYIIDGQPVTLSGGYSEIPIAPGSASKTITEYFGNEAVGDLNGDGTPDIAFLLTQTSGGSGTFYYVVVALKTSNGYQGTNAVFLGDRIAPQNTEIQNGEVIVNYADRNPAEPMTAQPSLGKSMYLKVVGATLEKVSN